MSVLRAGLYFQIRDDYCNLSLKEYSENKSFCEDLTEGKFSFPIIHAIQSQDTDKQVLRKYFHFFAILNFRFISKDDASSRRMCELQIDMMKCFKFLDILRQRTRDVEVKKYCVSLLEKLGSFKYTRETLESLDKEARNEVELLGPNPIMNQLLDELLSWKTSTD